MFTDAAYNGIHFMHLDKFLDHKYHDDRNDTGDPSVVAAIKHELYLVNLSTKETKKLPTIPKEEKYRSSINLYGIGFDHSTYEHKVVKGLYTKYNCLINLLLYDFDEDGVFSVYTLEADSWRTIEGSLPYRFCASEPGIVLNGDLHWFRERLGDQSRLIVSVALTGEERVREIPLPLDCGYAGSTNRRMKLGVFR
ncbi:hypothetical protein FF1_029589 [Malus domestica]